MPDQDRSEPAEDGTPLIEAVGLGKAFGERRLLALQRLQQEIDDLPPLVREAKPPVRLNLRRRE